MGNSKRRVCKQNKGVNHENRVQVQETWRQVQVIYNPQKSTKLPVQVYVLQLSRVKNLKIFNLPNIWTDWLNIYILTRKLSWISSTYFLGNGSLAVGWIEVGQREGGKEDILSLLWFEKWWGTEMKGSCFPGGTPSTSSQVGQNERKE